MTEYIKSIPTRQAEVLVIGGGPAGLSAAIASARTGAKTLLIEQGAFCGGMATAGLVAPFMTCYDSGGDEMLIKGLFEEIIDRLVEMGGALHPSTIPASSPFSSYIEKGHIHLTPFKAESLKLLADRMLKEAGVEVLYHTAFIDAICEGEQVVKVVVAKKEGLCAIEPKVIVDCTGDGDCAAAAGVPYTMGNGEGRMQPATMFFRIGNVDIKKIDEDIEKNRHQFYRKDGVNYRSLHWWVSKAREAGDFHINRASIGLYRGVEEDEWSINTSRILGIDGTSSESLTFGEQEGREQVDEIFRFFKKYVPGCENAKLLQSGNTLGIRETRHIHGIKTLVLEDLLECRVPEDSIMICANSVDVHGRFGPTSTEYITIPEGKYYGIPYGTLVPENRSNLLVAGRCLSADSEAAGAVRVMPPCMGMGQAAGTAAALACKEGTDLRRLDTKTLRAELIKNNVKL